MFIKYAKSAYIITRDTTVNIIEFTNSSHKRLFSILTRYIFIFVSKNFIFSIMKNKISFVATSFISTHRKFYVFRSSLYFTHIHCECIKFLSSTVYLEISSKILPYRLYDVTFHNILLCGNVFVSVLMLVCTLVCTYVTA